MADRELNINIPVSPTLDRKAVTDLRRDLSQMMNSIEKIDNNIGGKTIKSAAATAKQLKDIAKSAAQFTSALSRGTSDAFKEFDKLSKEINQKRNEAKKYAEELSTLGDDSPAKAQLETKLAETEAKLDDLTKSGSALMKGNQKYLKVVKLLSKEQEKQLKKAKSMASYGKGDLAKGVFGSLKRGGPGAVAGVAEALGEGMLSSRSRKALAAKREEKRLTKLSRRQLKAGDVAGSESSSLAAASSGAQAAKLLASLGPMALAIAGTVAAVGGLAYGLVKASQYISGLNKSLVENIPTVADSTYSTSNYTKALDEMRTSLLENEETINMLGGTLEQSAKGANAFSTGVGGFVRGYNLIEQMDGGMKAFQTNLIVYGKSLGMTTEEVGTRIASFYTDYGYGAKSANDMFVALIDNARAANMPVNKFMNIFDETIPGLSLYTNRMEELTNIMRMLSKTMSPDQVRQFMQALGRGFKGKGPMDRLHDVLIAGQEKSGEFKMSGILKEDFAGKMTDLTRDMGDELSVSLRRAFASGNETEFLRAIKKAETNPTIPPAKLGALKDTFYAEKMRQKGDPLSLATAAKAGSTVSLVKSIQAKGQNIFGDKFDRFQGISEIAGQKIGISSEEQEAYNSMIAAIKENMVAIHDNGTTQSRALDKALAEQVGRRLGKNPLDLTLQEFQTATQDDMLKALSYHQENLNKMDDDKDIQKLIRDKTTSIDEKITQVIARLLHKISETVMNIYDKISSWFTSSTAVDKSEKRYIPKLESYREQYMALDDKDVKNKGMISKSEYSGVYRRAIELAGTDLGRDKLGNSQVVMQKAVEETFDTNILKNLDADQLRSVGISPDQFIKGTFTQQEDGSLKKEELNLLDVMKRGEFGYLSPREFLALAEIPGMKLGRGASSRGTHNYDMPVEKIKPKAEADDTIRDVEAHKAKFAEGGFGMASGANSSSFGANAMSSFMKVFQSVGSVFGGSPVGTGSTTAESPVAKTAESTADTADTLNKGVVNEIGNVAELVGKNANAFFASMKEAVRGGVEVPLYDHALFLAKIQADPDYAKLGTAKNLPPQGLHVLSGFFKNDGETFDDAFSRTFNNTPQFADGGVMPHTGLALLHAGEIVTNPAKGQSTGPASVVINLPFMSNATPGQVARAVAGEMYRIFNIK